MPEVLEKTKETGSRSLAATMAIAFVALSVVTLLVASGIELYVNIQSQQEVVVGEQRLIAQKAANEVALFVQERFGELESAIKFSNMINATAAEAEQALEQILGAELVFRQVALLDGQGEMVARASRLSQTAGKDITTQLEVGALAQVRENGRYISPVYIDEETFEPLVVMAVPVLDIFDDYQGTLIAEANLKFMWDLVDRLEVGTSGKAYVVDRQGNLLAYGDVTRVIAGENLSQLEEVAEFVNRDDGGIEAEESDIDISTGIEGANVLSTYVPLGEPDWAVVTEVPVTEAYTQQVIESIVTFTIIIGIAAVLAGVIGIYLARRLAAPVRQLTNVASQVAEGDLSLQAKAEGPTEVKHLAGAFNNMTERINELVHSLEERVTARTQRLELVASLSEQLVAILDFEELLIELVNQVKSNFGYYHAHVYMLDESRQNLVMTAGAGEAGRMMKARGHGIRYDAPTSLVARAARTGEIVWVDNVREAEDWLPNPLLPETYSEMAIPIILDEQVMGVLDVQEARIGGLDEGDASVLRSLANQVAVAIRNARLFANVETALAEAQSIQNRYLAQAWRKAQDLYQGVEFSYRRPDAPLLDQAITTQLEQEATTHNQPIVVVVNGQDQAQQEIDHVDDQDQQEQSLTTEVLEARSHNAVVAPIKLQNQVIGTIQLHQADQPRHWDEQDLSLIQAIADQVAQSAENLRLFEETRQRAGREQTLREITEKMRAATNLEELVKTTAEELSQRFHSDYALVDLGIDDTSPELSEQPENGHT